jgi:uncharacterized protein YqeY
MRDRILNDLKNAMKNQNKELLSVIRMVKGAMQLEEINKKRELNDEEIISVVAKQIKTRKESIIEFEKGNRDDLIAKTKEEITILEKYMPEQLDESKVIEIINNAFELVKPSNQSDMGKIMNAVMPQLKGKADMSFVNKIIKEKLSSNN